MMTEGHGSISDDDLMSLVVGVSLEE